SSLGLISTEVTHVSFVNPVGVVRVIHSITLFFGCAGTVYGTPFKTRSGCAVHPFAGHWIAGGASFSSPAGAPLSAHLEMMPISLCCSEGSFEKWPTRGSADHGGILRLSTAAFIALAHGRVL